MDDSFSRLYEIYHAVLDLPDERRQQFLDQECGNDSALLEDVKRLLARGDNCLEDRLGAPANLLSLSASLTTSSGEDDCQPGQRIGVYEIERVIGQGGSGTVALAFRRGDFSQQVAIKVLRRDRVSNQTFIRRFEIERQLLSDLQHENIAGLIDGGCTDSGQPYLVMEYVDGNRITDVCEQNHLMIADRLRLFQTVCQAVGHAHRFGVIHRDIKPSNILISSSSVPKLVDFGIAKLVQKRDDESFRTVTVDGELPMTPEYASPEQLKNEAIGTASDIYSLGVVLFEMLTGARPYDFSSRSIHELVRVVCEEEPEAPSSALKSSDRPSLGGDKSVDSTSHDKNRRLAAELKGDLDHIVLKAMRKEPELRYASVDEFSHDIERYFAGLPVTARRGTIRYKTFKFLSRNAVAVSLGVALLMMLLSGFVGMSLLTTRLIAEREQNRSLLVEANLISASENIDLNNIESGLRSLDRAISLIGEKDPGFDIRYMFNRATETKVDTPVILSAGERIISSPYDNQPIFVTATAANKTADAGIRTLNSETVWKNATPQHTFLRRDLPYFAHATLEPPTVAAASHVSTNRLIYFQQDFEKLTLANLETGKTIDEHAVIDVDNLSAAVVLALSPDGSLLASLHTYGRILLFDLRNGEIEQKCLLRIGQIGGFAIRFSPDGKNLAAVNENGTVKIWSMNGFKLRFSQTLDRTIPFSLCWSNEGDRLFVGTRNGQLWQLTVSEKELSLQATLKFSPNAIAVSANGKLLAIGGQSLHLLDLDSWQPLAESTCINAIVDLRFSQADKSLISTDVIGTARAWAVSDLKGNFDLTGGNPAVEDVFVDTETRFAAVHPNEQLFAFRKGNVVRIFRRDGGQEVGKPIELDCSNIWTVSFSCDGKLMSASHHGTRGAVATILDFDSRKVVREILGGQEFTFSSASNRFAVRLGRELLLGRNADLIPSNSDAELKTDQRIVAEHKVHKYAVASTKPLVATVDESKSSVNIWDVSSHEQRLVFSIDVRETKQFKPRVACAFSPDSSRLVLAYDQTLELWDVEKCKRVFVDLNADLSISRPFFSPNSDILGVVSNNGHISLLDGKTGSRRLTLEAMGDGIPKGFFSRDGNSLIAGTNRIRIWNAVPPEEFSRRLPSLREELKQLEAAR